MEKEQALAVLMMIADDMAADASAFDGKPFNGRTVGEYFGNQGAAIKAVANIVKAMLLEPDEPVEGREHMSPVELGIRDRAQRQRETGYLYDSAETACADRADLLIWLDSERTMSAAWQKRAYQAEAEFAAARAPREQWAPGIDHLLSVNAALHAVRSAWRIDLQEGQAVAVPTPDVHSEFVAAAPREPLEQISQEMRELATGMRQHCERRVAPDANVRIWAAFLDAWAGQLAAARSALPPPPTDQHASALGDNRSDHTTELTVGIAGKSGSSPDAGLPFTSPAALPQPELEALSVADTQSLLGADRPISIGKVPTDPIGMRALAAIVRHRVRCSQELPAFWRCTACGCLWRDNRVFHDESVSLSSAKQTSCPECEMKPTAEVCEPLFRQPNVAALPRVPEPDLFAVLLEPEMPQTMEAAIQAAKNLVANEAHYREAYEALRAALPRAPEPDLWTLLDDAGAVLAWVEYLGESYTCPECSHKPHRSGCRLSAALEAIVTAINVRAACAGESTAPRAPEPDLEAFLSALHDWLYSVRRTALSRSAEEWQARIETLRASRAEARVPPEAFEKNGIRHGERVVCIDVPRLLGTVIRCATDGVDVRWDDGTLGELVWNDAVAYNAYRLQIVRADRTGQLEPTVCTEAEFQVQRADEERLTEVFNAAYEAGKKAARADPEPPRCAWDEDEDGVWRTDCGHAWTFEDSGAPAAHKARFCFYCWLPITAHTYATRVPPQETK